MPLRIWLPIDCTALPVRCDRTHTHRVFLVPFALPLRRLRCHRTIDRCTATSIMHTRTLPRLRCVARYAPRTALPIVATVYAFAVAFCRSFRYDRCIYLRCSRCTVTARSLRCAFGVVAILRSLHRALPRCYARCRLLIVATARVYVCTHTSLRAVRSRLPFAACVSPSRSFAIDCDRSAIWICVYCVTPVVGAYMQRVYYALLLRFLILPFPRLLLPHAVLLPQHRCLPRTGAPRFASLRTHGTHAAFAVCVTRLPLVARARSLHGRCDQFTFTYMLPRARAGCARIFAHHHRVSFAAHAVCAVLPQRCRATPPRSCLRTRRIVCVPPRVGFAWLRSD